MKLITNANLELIIQEFYALLQEEFKPKQLEEARTLTIGETGKKFDGSQDVFWSLNEIGAAHKDDVGLVSNLTTSNKGSVVAAINELQNNKATIAYVNDAISNVEIEDVVTASEFIGNIEDIENDYVTQAELEDALANLDDIDIEGMVTAVDVGNVDIEQGGSNNGGSFDLSNITMYDIKAYDDSTIGQEIEELWQYYNELFQSANNGKELIASAIGSPLSSSDTFSAMSTKINTLTTNFKSALLNKGVAISGTDTFQSLITKIESIDGGGDNTGVKVATGELNISTVQKTFEVEEYDFSTGEHVGTDTFTTPCNTFTIDFEPSMINAEASYLISGGYAVDCFYSYNNMSNTNAKLNIEMPAIGLSVKTNLLKEGNTVYLPDVLNIVSQQESVQYTIQGSTYTAIGMGEEGENNTNGNDAYVQQLSCGANHSIIFQKEGDVYGCGDNGKKQLFGLTDSTYTTTTKLPFNSSTIKQIVIKGNFTLVLTNNGDLWAIGEGDSGQLGSGSYSNLSAFTQVNSGVKQVSAGPYHTFILKNDGTLWATGSNGKGQLGIGSSTVGTPTFTQVTTNINNDVKYIACGWQSSFILKNDGTVWSCGVNNYGQLGLGDTTDKNVFTQVTTNINNDVKQIVCGYWHTFILKNDGSIWSCGHNSYGQLGLGTFDNNAHSTFTQVTTNINNDVRQISCGYYHTFILKNDRSIWSCGRNDYAQLGLGDTTNQSTFTQVTTNINNDVKEVACGQYYAILLKNDGSVWSCGLNNYGQLGLGDTTQRNTFTKTNLTINVENSDANNKDVFRDSLASILTDEGVNVTEEDDMASLITKVDSEFDRQVVPAGNAVASDVLSGKTFINSTGQTITGTAAIKPPGYNIIYNAGTLNTDAIGGFEHQVYESSANKSELLYNNDCISITSVNNASPLNPACYLLSEYPIIAYPHTKLRVTYKTRASENSSSYTYVFSVDFVKPVATGDRLGEYDMTSTKSTMLYGVGILDYSEVKTIDIDIPNNKAPFYLMIKAQHLRSSSTNLHLYIYKIELI